jgi:hypothetical protein
MGVSTGNAPGRAGGNRRKRSNGIHDALTKALSRLERRLGIGRLDGSSRFLKHSQNSDAHCDGALHIHPVDFSRFGLLSMGMLSSGYGGTRNSEAH